MTGAADRGAETVHASCVALAERAVLIRGAAGRGKSGLALQLLSLGAELVADDRTRLWLEEGRVMAEAPATIRGQIEARGVGILRLPCAGARALALVVDMDRDAEDRLPPLDHTEVMGLRLPCLKRVPHAHFPAAILLYLRHGDLS